MAKRNVHGIGSAVLAQSPNPYMQALARGELYMESEYWKGLRQVARVQFCQSWINYATEESGWVPSYEAHTLIIKPKPKPVPVHVNGMDDACMTLGEWRTKIKQLIDEHTATAVLRVDGGHNNVSFYLEQSE